MTFEEHVAINESNLPPCERSYRVGSKQHPRFPSGDCVECGALCTESCKHPLAEKKDDE